MPEQSVPVGTAAPQANPKRTLPMYTVRQLTAQYLQHSEWASNAQSALRKIIEADPETQMLESVRMREASYPIRAITLAQAASDPTLRIVMLEELQVPATFEECRRYFAEGLKIDGVDFASATNPEQLLSMIVRSESAYQEGYATRSAKLNVTAEASELLVQATKSAVVKQLVEDYFRNTGYVFDEVSKQFKSKP